MACTIVLSLALGLAPRCGDEHSRAQEPSAADTPAAAPDGATALPLRGPAEPLRNALETITGDELLEHASFLAADALEGRAAGSAGGQKAGDYLIEQLRALGLSPAGTDGEFVQACGPNMRNILAKLPGSDPQVAEEVVLVGAHYDHIGQRPPREPDQTPTIFNGANDNASGVAGVLELAEAMVALPVAPRRTILFALWDGEERGFVGSRFFVKQPTVPLDRIVFVIALDMIGRLNDERFVVWGTGTANGLRQLVARQNVLPNLDLDFRTYNLALSDQQPFFQRGIPVLLPSTGIYPELHRPEDDIELLNVDGMRRATQLVHAIVYDLAQRDTNFQFAEIAREESSRDPRRATDPPAPSPEDAACPLGFTFRRDPREPGVWLIVQVTPDSPAALAGLQAADRLCQWNGADVETIGSAASASNETAEPVRWLIERNGKFHVLDARP